MQKTRLTYAITSHSVVLKGLNGLSILLYCISFVYLHWSVFNHYLTGTGLVLMLKVLLAAGMTSAYCLVHAPAQPDVTIIDSRRDSVMVD